MSLIVYIWKSQLKSDITKHKATFSGKFNLANICFLHENINLSANTMVFCEGFLEPITGLKNWLLNWVSKLNFKTDILGFISIPASF